jgi:hypothetical protein
MNDLERILDDCVERLTKGTSTVEECLSAYPEHAAQLRPLLESAGRIIRRPHALISISPPARARGRAKLSAHMKAHPRRRGSRILLFQRLALGLAVMMFALLSAGTVRAQSALPSDLFYTWKLVSERVWRGISFNDTHVDLVLADRRVNEIVATANDPSQQAVTLHDYEVILARIEARQEETDVEEDQILSRLETHQKSLKDAGFSVPQLDDYLRPRENDSSILPELPKMPFEHPSVIDIP